MNREAWLQAAVEELRPLFRGNGHELPPVHVSMGWPSRGALSSKSRVIGQCWHGTQSEDGKAHIFISPVLEAKEDVNGVLPTLVHELCHVVAGPDAKHGPKFAKIATKMLLEGNPTVTVGSAVLMERLAQIVAKLGPFPHAKLVPTPKERKPQTTRMKKASCTCGYTIRLSQKWADVGVPSCPVDKVLLVMDAAVVEEGE